ncbi:hypothetical protein STANM309S_03499 [Streptomyces tanashiensis]
MPSEGVPAAVSGSVMVAQTVTSVGPYALIIRRSCAVQRSTSSAVHASPATSRLRTPGRSAAGTLAAATGGSTAWLTASPVRTSVRVSPARVPVGGTTRAAPASRTASSSKT